MVRPASPVKRMKRHAIPDTPEPSNRLQALPAAEVLPVRVVDTAELFAGGREVALRFGDAVYHLKITRLGKLILNK